MKSILKEIVEKTRIEEQGKKAAIEAEIDNPSATPDYRNFLREAAFGGIAPGGLVHLSIEDTIARTAQKVSRTSSPSDLKITDLRVARKGYGGFPARIIKIYTNQGLTGIGDIRDGTDQRFALFLKSKIVGLNPRNVEMILKVIKQFGFHGLQGAGMSVQLKWHAGTSAVKSITSNRGCQRMPSTLMQLPNRITPAERMTNSGFKRLIYSFSRAEL